MRSFAAKLRRFAAKLQAGQIASLQAQLDAAILGSSNNSNSVGNLSETIANDPPTAAEVQPIADKVDELINALRR